MPGEYERRLMAFLGQSPEAQTAYAANQPAQRAVPRDPLAQPAPYTGQPAGIQALPPPPSVPYETIQVALAQMRSRAPRRQPQRPRARPLLGLSGYLR